MSEYQKEPNMVVSAMKADVHPQTARKYIQAAKPPEELQHKHDWRTRPDPLAAIWEPAQQMLCQAPELEAKELFDYLRGLHGEEVAASALRSFQRRVLQWRLLHGKDKEVFFAQEHQPGRVMQVDWTDASALAVTVRGVPLDHLLCHSVLPYSNWSWATRCQSESMLSLRHGLQESLHQLGRTPERVQIDNSSAATHHLGTGGREFNGDFLALVEHYGLKPQTIGIKKPHQNGDIESRNGHLKRRLQQHLLLRGHRDFEAAEAYDQFLLTALRKANQNCSVKLKEELEAMRPLPPTRLSEHDEVRCPVSRHSTIRVKKVTSSVPARLIGQEVNVEVYEGHLKIYHGRQLLLELARATGDRGVKIDYRHLIDHLLRKPGAFTHYVHREEFFPDSAFRLAYDRLVGDHGLRAGQIEYLHLLKWAAELGVSALSALVGEWAGPSRPGRWRAADLRRYVNLDAAARWPDLALEPELSGYDALLERPVSHE